MAHGETIIIKGEIVAGEDVTLAGTVHGRIAAPGHAVTLTAGSRVTADVDAESIDVAGSLEGTLVASQRLHVRGTADIQGDLQTPRLTIDEGAHVQGKVEMATGPRGLVAIA
jgi:cytoskeletal protein CcmA (bactofilin family)